MELTDDVGDGGCRLVPGLDAVTSFVTRAIPERVGEKTGMEVRAEAAGLEGWPGAPVPIDRERQAAVGKVLVLVYERAAGAELVDEVARVSMSLSSVSALESEAVGVCCARACHSHSNTPVGEGDIGREARQYVRRTSSFWLIKQETRINQGQLRLGTLQLRRGHGAHSSSMESVYSHCHIERLQSA